MPGLTLVVAMPATGYDYAAAITSVTPAQEGLQEMLGGTATLDVLVIILKALTECRIETVFKAALAVLKRK